MKRRLVCSIFIVFALLAISVFAAPEEPGKAAEKLQVIKKELKENKEKLQETKEKRQQVFGKLVVITQELKHANKQLNRAHGKIIENNSKIGELTVEIKKTEKDLREKSEIVKKRITEAYKNGQSDYLDIILSSRSMSDFLSRFYFFEKIISRDAKMISGVRNDLRGTSVKKNDLSQKNMEIKELTQVIVEQKQKISEQEREERKVLAELKEREEEYKEKIAELEKSSQELEVLIKKKVAERAVSGIYARGTGSMMWPMKGRITLRFGVRHRLQGRHTGLDIAAPYGTPVAAADSGEVIFAGWWDGYGKAIVIDHGKGLSTVYAHLSRIYSSVGSTVDKGQTIGLEGSTGYSTGPHLHFEVRKNGVPQNPQKYL